MMRRPPKHVQGFIDRWGKPRFYLRRKGFPRTPLPGLPWSPQFMQAYEQAMSAGQQPLAAGADKVKPLSMRALAISYYASAAFKALKPITKGVYSNLIDRFCRETDRDGQPYGDKSAVTLKRENVEKMMQARADRPDSANGLRKVLRELMKHAVTKKWRTDDPTQGVSKIKPKSMKGFHRWNDAEIAQFEAKYAIGTKPRLAMALGLFTGQARQDVIAMGEQHISLEYDAALAQEIEVLNWVRKKTEDQTGLELAIPLHPKLREIIGATPSGHLNFLVTELGKPFTAAGFGNWFRDQCNAAGLPHCSFHGLRKAAATRLADAGCDPMEIAAITGHASLKEVQRYTMTRDRKKAARRAMAKLVSGTEVSNPVVRFDKQAKKA
jgi:integrase